MGVEICDHLNFPTDIRLIPPGEFAHMDSMGIVWAMFRDSGVSNCPPPVRQAATPRDAEGRATAEETFEVPGLHCEQLAAGAET